MTVISLVLIAFTFFLFSPIFVAYGCIGAVLFTPSALVDQLSKKIGSVVFSRNHYKQYARIKVKPINPKSAAQSAQRTLLSDNAKAWKILTQPQILVWNALAGKIPKSNRLGVKGTLTGESLYVSLNNNIVKAGGTAISDAPSIDLNSVSNLLGVGITVISGVITMSFTPGSIATNIVEVSASPALSGGRTYNSEFKVIGTFASNATSPEVLTTMYNAIFGTAPVTGNVVFFKFRVIDNLSGFASQSEKVRVVCA